MAPKCVGKGKEFDSPRPSLLRKEGDKEGDRFSIVDID